jgi:hypothetical protein
MRMADAAIGTAAPVLTAAAFGERRNAGLKQLIGRQAEKVRDGVKVLQLNFAVRVQEFVDPTLFLAE